MDMPLYGAFDSRVKFPRVIKTEKRPVEYFEVELYVEDQPGVCFIDDRVIPLKKGTLICAKPGQMRCSQLHFKCLFFHLDTKDPQVVRILTMLPTATILGEFGVQEELFRKLIRLDPESFPEDRLLLQSSLLELIYSLSAYAGSYARHSNGAHRQVMASMDRYIRDNLKEDLSLNGLAAVANLSSSYFHKLFCSHFGITPSEYVLQCRISAAKVYLMEGQFPIGDVAEQCGFASQSYFNFRFKQAVGVTPLQYRRERLSQMEV